MIIYFDDRYFRYDDEHIEGDSSLEERTGWYSRGRIWIYNRFKSL